MTHDLRALLELRTAAPVDWADELLVLCDRPGTMQLHVARDGRLEQLTSFDEPVTGHFVPGSGRILLELDDAGNERTQLYLLDAQAGAEAEPLVVEPQWIHWTPQTSRDGRLLAYGTNRRNGRDFDVVVRELESGEERVVFDRGGWNGVAGFSPDGRLVAILRDTERSGDNELWLVDLDTGETFDTAPHAEEAELGRPAWLPDGSAFFASTSVGRDTAAIARFDLASRAWETVVESPWDLDCAIDDDGRRLLVHANEDGFSRLELRDPRTHESVRDVDLPGRGHVHSPVFSPDGSQLAFAFGSPVEPTDVWVYDVDGRTLARASDLPRPEAPLREPELHRLDSFDGESVPVFLWEPEGDGPFPVVVMVHGGPEAQFLPGWLQSFTPFTQYLLSRGYAVAAPNVRGSSGYGKRYEHLDDVRLRLDSVRDLALLHAWLDSRPRIDASRAVLYGRSYGGYMVLAGLAFQPELWAAGIESVGISNLVTFLENTGEWRRVVREREYGSLEHDQEFLLEASPLTHLERMRAPLFIQHGANDPRVPLSETQQIHRALNEKGVRCELVVYEDEGHAIGKLENRVDFFERAVAFLDDVLA